MLELDGLERQAADTGATPLMAKISALRAQANALIDERSAIERGNLSIAETLVICETALQDGRKGNYLKMISDHMAEVQRHHARPFQEMSLRPHRIREFNEVAWVFGWVSEDDLVAASKLLESDGLSEKEKIKKIAGLNEKISTIKADMRRRIKEYHDSLNKILG